MPDELKHLPGLRKQRPRAFRPPQRIWAGERLLNFSIWCREFAEPDQALVLTSADPCRRARRVANFYPSVTTVTV